MRAKVKGNPPSPPQEYLQDKMVLPSSLDTIYAYHRRMINRSKMGALITTTMTQNLRVAPQVFIASRTAAHLPPVSTARWR
jgi:hypothetical protein